MKWLIVALLLGVVMRGYQMHERFIYAHDNDLASWIVKDIVVDKHWRLVGQLTSSPGVFIGPLWYWLQIPFYLAANMDPMYVPILSVLVGVAGIISIYYVMGRLYTPLAGKVAAVVYAASYAISTIEREVVPTTPVFLWSIWFLYAIHLLLAGRRRGLLIVAILWSLIWHINLALVFSVPVVIGVLAYNRARFKVKDFIWPAMVLAVLSLPLIVFEGRHQFGQVRAFVAAPQTARSAADLVAKAGQIGFYAAKNVNAVFWARPEAVSVYLLPLVLMAAGLVVLKHRLVYVVWAAAYALLFLASPLNLSEYYLNGLTIIWIVITAVVLARVFQSRPLVLALILAAFSIYNLSRLMTANIDRSGYRQKKQLVEHIKADAASHGYPCIAVSYMTDVGRDFGYRYWFWLNDLHVNRPASGSPVYTVVWPHSRAGRLDQSFGSIGLVYPDYDRYTPEAVTASCAGANANLTDPMFGFVN